MCEFIYSDRPYLPINSHIVIWISKIRDCSHLPDILLSYK